MNRESGFILITALFVILLLSILALVAASMVTSELKFASDDRESKKGFYIAEGGVEEVRARMQTTSPNPIVDNSPSNPNWKLFVGDLSQTQEKGFDAGNTNHVRYDKIVDLGYVVTVTHKLNEANQVLRWGDANSDGLPEENTTFGNPIYVITSEGQTETGRTKTIRIEASSFPEISKFAALYTKEPTEINGASAYITGIDQCSSTTSVPGILSKSSVNESGHPTIDGFPAAMLTNDATDLKVEKMIDSSKWRASYNYYYSSDQTLSGMNWGVPVAGATPQSPTICSVKNVVYFNMNGKGLKLAGGTTGCGLLMVKGDLEVNGGFQWYGAILVTGSIKYTGGGEKNVTGMMLSAGVGKVDQVGGNAAIVFCGTAIDNQTKDLPLVVLRWEELNG
jgi:Tfp pilus assembly protein PilX